MIYKKAVIIAVASVLAIVVVVLASQGDESNTADIEKAILERLAEIQDVAQGMDPEKVFSYVLENDKGALITDGKLFLTRQEAFESTKRGFEGLQMVDYKFYQQHVTTLSPTVALAVSEGSTSFTTADGRSFITPFAQTVVFVLSDGEWQVLHAHRSFPRQR
jgi:hypothetical protein